MPIHNLQVFLRKWHRWIALPAVLLLAFAAITGIVLAATEFFGADEALREQLRRQPSPVTAQSSDAEFAAALARARATVAATVGSAPLDKIEWQFKGPEPTLTFFVGKPRGGEDRELIVAARSGRLLRIEAYADKPFMLRLHSGEWFGDGGLVVAMLWGLSLVLLSASGTVIYFKMRRPGLTGLRRGFW